MNIQNQFSSAYEIVAQKDRILPQVPNYSLDEQFTEILKNQQSARESIIQSRLKSKLQTKLQQETSIFNDIKPDVQLKNMEVGDLQVEHSSELQLDFNVHSKTYLRQLDKIILQLEQREKTTRYPSELALIQQQIKNLCSLKASVSQMVSSGMELDDFKQAQQKLTRSSRISKKQDIYQSNFQPTNYESSKQSQAIMQTQCWQPLRDDVISDFSVSEDESLLEPLRNCLPYYGHTAAKAFAQNQRVLPIRIPDEIAAKIQPDFRLFTYQQLSFVPELQIGDTSRVPPQSFADRFTLHMFHQKYLNIFEANVSYTVLLYLLYCYPELVYRSDSSFKLQKVVYYLPKYATSAEVVHLSKIHPAAPNHFENKIAPHFALVGVNFAKNFKNFRENAGNAAVPYYQITPRIAIARSVRTLKSGVRQVEFDDTGVINAVNGMLKEVRESLM
ncbi:Conserved_hypothetical protein [Hexamita inflata]|uniref:Uncharacterized protein n=1 Tax=Hexamita inflata TaxID=28002 RepID=A0AA86PW58_9EUKA|nr:Conserved hypothetical protein [Hexamita inflata]